MGKKAATSKDKQPPGQVKPLNENLPSQGDGVLSAHSKIFPAPRYRRSPQRKFPCHADSGERLSMCILQLEKNGHAIRILFLAIEPFYFHRRMFLSDCSIAGPDVDRPVFRLSRANCP